MFPVTIPMPLWLDWVQTCSPRRIGYLGNERATYHPAVDASATTFPARLHVLLAREAAYAIVFRRGPSKEVCTIGWNRATDEFSVGQWLKGRIYERRADLSPDGKLLIYFASN